MSHDCPSPPHCSICLDEDHAAILCPFLLFSANVEENPGNLSYADVAATMTGKANSKPSYAGAASCSPEQVEAIKAARAASGSGPAPRTPAETADPTKKQPKPARSQKSSSKSKGQPDKEKHGSDGEGDRDHECEREPSKRDRDRDRDRRRERIIPAIVAGSAIALTIDAKRGTDNLLGMTTTKATWSGYRSNAKTDRDVSIANVP